MPWYTISDWDNITSRMQLFGGEDISLLHAMQLADRTGHVLLWHTTALVFDGRMWSSGEPSNSVPIGFDAPNSLRSASDVVWPWPGREEGWEEEGGYYPAFDRIDDFLRGAWEGEAVLDGDPPTWGSGAGAWRRRQSSSTRSGVQSAVIGDGAPPLGPKVVLYPAWGPLGVSRIWAVVGFGSDGFPAAATALSTLDLAPGEASNVLQATLNEEITDANIQRWANDVGLAAVGVGINADWQVPAWELFRGTSRRRVPNQDDNALFLVDDEVAECFVLVERRVEDDYYDEIDSTARQRDGFQLRSGAAVRRLLAAASERMTSTPQEPDWTEPPPNFDDALELDYTVSVRHGNKEIERNGNLTHDDALEFALRRVPRDTVGASRIWSSSNQRRSRRCGVGCLALSLAGSRTS